ncbi:MAG: dihydroorotase [Clostridia bacterium]|nr:dihydroorotase [Clostridia bacterium]
MGMLIKSGHVVDPANGLDGIYDILIEGVVIKEVAPSIDSIGMEEVDAGGLHVFPGFFDAHCHLREPGYEYKEDIESGTKAAAAGGFTSVACMPNTNPVADNDSVIRLILDRASEKGCVKVYPIGSITKGSEGTRLAEMGFMKQAGAVAVSDDGKPVESADIMKKALEYASGFGLPVISHCEEMSLSEGGAMNDGFVSTSLGLKGIPAAAEEIQVARDVLLSECTGVPVHIAHISTGGSAGIIRAAKARGVRVTCETCPHYFSLTEDECEGFNPYAKVNPPLRNEKDRLAVIEALRDGTVDFIATDHAPHHEDEKNVEFQFAANGISGFETAFSAAYTNLVMTGAISLGRLVDLMSRLPARFLNRYTGGLRPGAPADLTIADLSAAITVDSSKFLSKGRNTPFNGKQLHGRILMTIVNGGTAYRRDK